MRISFSASLDYGSHGREYARGDDLADVSRAELRWYYFLGSLRISQSGTEVGPPWGWVPLFDAIYSVRQVMTYVEGGGGLGKIDFTENDEVIRFELEGGDLRVMPSYTKSALSCAVGEFLAAGSGFIRREIVKVVSEYPSLLNNAHVHALAKDVDLELPQP